MAADKRTSPESKSGPAAERRRRQAEALRANLRRRKAASAETGGESVKMPKPEGAKDREGGTS